MKMATKIKAWKCDYCGQIYEDKKLAETCMCVSYIHVSNESTNEKYTDNSITLNLGIDNFEEFNEKDEED